MPDTAGTNLPLPDQLAATRAEIKRLQEYEGELKRRLIADPALRTGAEWLVEVKTLQQRSTDFKEMKAAHPALFDEYTYEVPVTRVVLSGIDQETGEIISARKARERVES